MKKAKRYLNFFVSVFLIQYGFVQYGTFVAFSWDVIEPITCAMTLGDACLAYLFWMISKKPYTLNGIREYFEGRAQRRLIKKYSLDYDNFLRTEKAIKIIKERLDELK